MGYVLRFLTLLVVVLLAGCGGGGGGNGGSGGGSAAPYLKVDWPQRGRDIAGPSSALSVQFVLKPSSGTSITIVGDRPAGTAAVVSTYTAPSTARTGTYNLAATFYASNGEQGAVVGTVNQQVDITSSGAVTNTNGTPLNVTFTSVIKSAEVNPNQSVSVGSSTTLTASAYDATGNAVVVTPGSFIFSGGSSDLTIAASGLATGVAIGSGPVTVTIDGVTSPAQTVTVTGQATASIVVDWPQRSRDVGAPSSALSCQFTLQPTGGSGSSITITGDRPSNINPNSATYQATASAPTGNYNLSGTFYAAAAEGGAVVGTVSIPVVLQANGSLLETTGAPLIVTFTPVITNVMIPANQIVGVGSTATLTATALNSTNNPVVVSQGSFIWTETSGSSYLTLAADGTATGVASGEATVTVKIDNLTSSPQTVGVSAGTSVPSLEVSWPLRSRQVNGPSSALSCSFTLVANGIDNPNVVITGDRPAGTAANVATYSASTSAQIGTYTLTGNFYANPSEGGAVVGTINVPVAVSSSGTITQPNGLPLDVNFTPVITSAQVNPNQGVAVGSTTTLTASAYNSKGNIVVVTQGSFLFSLANNSTALSLAVDGTATGVAVGSAEVQVAIDNVVSSAQNVIVTPASTGYGSVAIDCNDVVYDYLHNTVWVSASSSSGIDAGEVVPINASTLAAGTAIATGNSPTFMCLSSDGNYLYVGGANGTVVQIVLASDAIGETITLPTGTVPSELQALPGSPQSVIVSLVGGTSNQTDEGTAIYDGTTERANAPQIGQWSTVNSSGNRIYGYQQYQSSGSLYTTANIDSTGIDTLSSSVTAVQGATNRIYWSNNYVVSDNGIVLSPDSGTELGSITFSETNTVAAVDPGTNYVYFNVWSPMEIQKCDISADQILDTFAMSAVSGTVGRAIYAGPSRVAFFTTGGGTADAVYVVSGLP